MSLFLRSSLVLLISMPLIGATQALELDTADKRLSYTLGYLYITQFAKRDVKIDTDAFSAAVDDIQDAKSTLMSKEEMNAVMQTYRKGLYTDIQEKADAALAAGNLFMAKNKKQPGVVVRQSGLQYIVHQAGKGESPDRESKVKVHYRGTLIDGTEFDSSKPGQPDSFKVEGVVRGLMEALPLMKPGAKWTVFIPSELGYGVAGSSPKVGPHEPLIFEIELISVE